MYHLIICGKKRQSFGITIEALLFVYFRTKSPIYTLVMFSDLLGENIPMFDLSDCLVYS